MDHIAEFQRQLHHYDIEFLAESDCDRILESYARFNQTKVACPFKPRVFLTKKRGNAGRTNITLLGSGKICFGNTPFEAKLNLVYSFLAFDYFRLDGQLQLVEPKRFLG